MKKILIVLLSALLLVSLVSCNGTDNKKDVDLSDPTLSITDCYDVPYQYDLSDYIDISREDYVGVEIEKIDTTVTDEDVNDAIFADLQEHATYADVERGAKTGDSININFTGSVDGVEFDGGAAENYDMVLGSAGFIPGFEDALVGHAAGEEFVIDVTFPEEYGNEELNGKDAQFAIKINSVKEEVLPEFSESFVKENYDCDTIEAYLAQVQERLIEEKAVEVDNERKSAAFEAVYENVEIKSYPDAEYKYYYNDFVSYYEDFAKENLGMDLETYITDYCNSTEDEFYYYADMNAAVNVEQEMICFAIATEEGLWQSLTKGDYDEYIAVLAADNDMDVASFEKNYGSDTVWIGLIMDKAINFVIDNAVEVEPTQTESEETPEETEAE